MANFQNFTTNKQREEFLIKKEFERFLTLEVTDPQLVIDDEIRRESPVSKKRDVN